MERADVRLEMDSKVSILKSGLIYMLPPEHPFEATYNRCKIKGFHLYLSDGFGFPVGSDFKGLQELDDPKLFGNIVSAVERDEEPQWQVAVFQAVVAFCKPLFPLIAQRAALSPSNRMVLEMIESNPPGSLRVESIAKHLRISNAALSKSFERHFKISLKRHLINVAMRKAKNYLLNSSLSISEIAFKLGYKEPNYFERLFKQEVGHTPMSYRKHGVAILRNELP